MDKPIEIKQTENGAVVSAKELYNFLGYDSSQWSRWYNSNIIKDNFFIENVDYQTLDIMSNGNPTKDFALNVNMAKELSMLARNENGKKARLYFIECEKKLNESKYSKELPQSFSEALMLAAKQAQQIELQSAELKKQAPKVEYFEKVMTSTSTYVTNQIAKELGTSAITLNRKLKDKKIIYKQNGTWMLYQKYQNKDYTRTKTYTYTDDQGNTKTSMQMVWSEKGRHFIHKIMREESQMLTVV